MSITDTLLLAATLKNFVSSQMEPEYYSSVNNVIRADQRPIGKTQWVFIRTWHQRLMQAGLAPEEEVNKEAIDDYPLD